MPSKHAKQSILVKVQWANPALQNRSEHGSSDPCGAVNNSFHLISTSLLISLLMKKQQDGRERSTFGLVSQPPVVTVA